MVTGISRFTKGEFNQDALDEVYNKGKELYKDPVAPPSSGIIYNTTDEIWSDMHDHNTGWVSNMPSGFGQFNGPYDNPNTDRPLQDIGYNFDNANVWIEVEAGGNGSGCSPDINLATNTRVEIGWLYGYIKRNGVWSLFTDAQRQLGDENGYPNQGGGSENSRNPCNKSLYDWSITSIRNTEPSGYYSVYPRGFIRWHGWSQQKNLSDPAGIEAIFATCYVRLIKGDPAGEDDRHLANFVVHASSDIRLDGKYVGDIGISRYRQILANGDWMPINFMTGMTKAELEANPPPIKTIP